MTPVVLLAWCVVQSPVTSHHPDSGQLSKLGPATIGLTALHSKHYLVLTTAHCLNAMFFKRHFASKYTVYCASIFFLNTLKIWKVGKYDVGKKRFSTAFKFATAIWMLFLLTCNCAALSSGGSSECADQCCLLKPMSRHIVMIMVTTVAPQRASVTGIYCNTNHHCFKRSFFMWPNCRILNFPIYFLSP